MSADNPNAEVLSSKPSSRLSRHSRLSKNFRQASKRFFEQGKSLDESSPNLPLFDIESAVSRSLIAEDGRNQLSSKKKKK